MKKQTAESSIVYIVKLSENITICEHIIIIEILF